MMLDADELAELREDFAATLPDTCTIGTMQKTANGLGGWTEEWTPQLSDVPCRFSPIKQEEPIVADQNRPVLDWMVELPFGVAIEFQHYLLFGSTYYSVLAVDNGRSEALCIQARVREVRT